MIAGNEIEIEESPIKKNNSEDYKNLFDHKENQITLNEDKYDFSGKEILVGEPIKITSRNRSKIICDRILVTSPSVDFEGIDFVGSIVFRNSPDCSIKNCTFVQGDPGSGACIVTTLSDNITLENVRISDSITSGIFCEMSTCKLTNVHVEGLDDTHLGVCSCILHISDCTFNSSKRNGIHILKSQDIIIENTTVSNTVYPAIFLINSNVRVRKCKVFSVEQNGITLNNSENVTISDCVITDIGASAISVCFGSDAIIERNDIHSINGNAIYVSDASQVIVRNNILKENKYPAVAILNDCKGKVYENEISNIRRSGICARGAAEVEARNNSISIIDECGISVSDTILAHLDENKIFKCKIGGIEAYNDSKCYANNNHFEDVGDYAFLSYAGAYLEAKSNKINMAAKAMVQLKWKGSGQFYDNSINDCPSMYEGETTGEFLFYGNSGFKNVTNCIEKQTADIEFVIPYVDTHQSLCLKCQKNPRDCFFQICGHRVYCQKCAQEVLDKHESCPLCRFCVDAITTGFSPTEDNECIICSSNKAECIVMPCGHMGFCNDCMKKWYTTSSACPFCRVEPSFYKKIITEI
ncbi:hypothetical protein TRFO_04441 [Tritrichomonas foetus]|uniref:RING-type domain-containing protein n=1 Tax=Tritrichomonas foetus TaxID=1144522 RepID=A0A1J4KKK3_9EUKA|nr:hypothetical protein TRFO_04441 [Tritrichomonas foetus]|eukprot:OHT09893.1 hypothetical protein TRFO_04441 [Tritrichomonas foetus]